MRHGSFVHVTLVGSLLVLGLVRASVAATIAVTSTADDLSLGPNGNCTLREAVIAANTNVAVDACPAGEARPLVDEIVVPAGFYVLTIVGDDDAANAGDLDLVEGAAVRGAGTAATVIDGNGTDRVFDLIDPRNSSKRFQVELDDLTVRNGNPPTGYGGGIRATLSDLVLRRVAVEGNHATAYGGGLSTSGANTTIDSCRLTGNVADQQGGGAQLSSSHHLITNTLIDHNSAPFGGGIRAVGADVALTDSEVSDNLATTSDGGGFYVSGAPPGTLADLRLVRTLVARNRGSNGGAIAVKQWHLRLSVDESTITENYARATGGGFYLTAGAGSVTDSTVSSNSAGGQGGGFLFSGGDTTVTNVTISGNVAGASGTNSTGGGVMLNLFLGGSAVFRNDTIVANSAYAGSAFGQWYSTRNVGNSIIQGTCDAIFGAKVSAGGNLESPGATCGLTDPTDLSNVPDLGLGPLAANGGPTLTHALAEDSPAIGHAVAANCPAADQRGVPRDDGACDSGAFELLVPHCVDADGDGYYVGDVACGPPIDCDDGNADVSPGATELPGNGIDDDCNAATTDCFDGDGDGYSPSGRSCGPVDCNDGDANVNPGHAEVGGNGVDDDCESATPDCVDADGDGYSVSGGVCGAVDCLDTNAQVNPGKTEVPGNGVDEDCNPATPPDGCASVGGDGGRGDGAPAGASAWELGLLVMALVAGRAGRARRAPSPAPG